MINHYIDMNAGQFGFKFHIFLSLNLLVDKVISPLTIPPLVTGSYHQQFNRENKSVQFYFYLILFIKLNFLSKRIKSSKL